MDLHDRPEVVAEGRLRAGIGNIRERVRVRIHGGGGDARRVERVEDRHRRAVRPSAHVDALLVDDSALLHRVDEMVDGRSVDVDGAVAAVEVPVPVVPAEAGIIGGGIEVFGIPSERNQKDEPRSVRVARDVRRGVQQLPSVVERLRVGGKERALQEDDQRQRLLRRRLRRNVQARLTRRAVGVGPIEVLSAAERAELQELKRQVADCRGGRRERARRIAVDAVAGFSAGRHRRHGVA